MMDHADKENRPVEGSAKSSRAMRPLSNKLASSSAHPDSPAQQRVQLASTPVNFPVADPDEDRDVLDKDGKTLRSRRSILFYPSPNLAAKSNQAPFSRSAAKRESIMALGSIGYLQHLYTKQGIANRNLSIAKGAMTLAIGPAGEAMLGSGTSPKETLTDSKAALAHLSSKSEAIAEDEEESFELPPSPKASTYIRLPYPNVAKSIEADPGALWPLLVEDLDGALKRWGLHDWLDKEANVAHIKSILLQAHFKDETRDTASRQDETDVVNVLELIESTTKAIRSVRAYLLALPNGSTIPDSAPNEPNRRDRFKRQSSFSGVARSGQGFTIDSKVVGSLSPMGTLSAPRMEQRKSLPGSWLETGSLSSPSRSGDPSDEPDHLSTLRKAALDLLSTLKDMEERNRLPSHPLNDNRENEEEGTSLVKPTSPTSLNEKDSAAELGVSSVDGDSVEPESLYETNLKLAQLSRERSAVQNYLVVVNTILSSIKPTQGSRRSSRAQSSSESDRGAVDLRMQATTAPTITIESDGSAPSHFDARGSPKAEWARIDGNPGDPTSRIRDFMSDHLQFVQGAIADFASYRGLSNHGSNLDALLSDLADGYLLCRAFNEAVRRSDKPWGYIQAREIHDLKEEEARLLQKESDRVKQIQESEKPAFETRTSRKSGSEGEDPDASFASLNSETLSNRPGWTFRKTENLRIWAAALKLRYQIQSTSAKASPSTPAAAGPTYGSLGLGKLALHGRRVASEANVHVRPIPSQQSEPAAIEFDPRKVARKEDGWQDMLTELLIRWIDAVAKEQLSRE